MATKTTDKTDDAPQGEAVITTGPVTPSDTAPSAEDTPPPKPHRKSNYMMLSPDQASEVTYPVTINGHGGTVILSARQGQVFHVVPDDSAEPGINQTLADSLLEKKTWVYCDKPDDEAQYQPGPPAPETPAGAMAASTTPAPAYSGPPNSPSYAGAPNLVS